MKNLAKGLLLFTAIFVCIDMYAECNAGFFETNGDNPVWYVEYGEQKKSESSSEKYFFQQGQWATQVTEKELYLDGALYLRKLDGNVYGSAYNFGIYYRSNKDTYPSSSSTFSYVYPTEWNRECKDKSISQFFTNKDNKLDDANTPGNYYVEYYLQAEKYEGSWEYNNDKSKQYCSNSDGKNYFIKHVYPGFIASDLPFNEVKKNKTSRLNYNFSSYGWATCTATITGGDGHFYFDGDDFPKTKTITINQDKGQVYITYAPDSDAGDEETATLTLYGTTQNNITKTITVKLTGTGISEHDVTVLLGTAPTVLAGPRVTLNGYLKYSGCDKSLTKYGFYIMKKGSHECSDILTYGTQIESTGTNLMSGSTWSEFITTGLEENTEYLYKPFVYSVDKKAIYSSADCGEFTTAGKCDPIVGDTIYYHIDGSLTYNEPCELKFQTIDDAFENLKSHNTNGAVDFWWDTNTSLLKKNVVFLIYQYAAGYGKSGKRVDLHNINRYSESSPTTPSSVFIIRSAEDGTKPLVYGLDLSRSRWITVKSLTIKRDAPSTEDGIGNSCILVGLNDGSTNATTVGKISDARVSFVNCQIEGDNFCCIHAHGLNGFYMEECNLIANCSDNSSIDTQDWGASIKFMNCNAIKLVRNNFKGAHFNNIFAQNVQNMLVMNNVFWNDNNVSRTKDHNHVSVIRLINYGASDNGHKIKNIGIYYNTMYLADGANTTPVDFLFLGGENGNQTQTATYYDAATIEFKNNNCYSYSTKVSGRNSNAFINLAMSGAVLNNFWSQYDADQGVATHSGFYFGSDDKYINVKDQVCQTAPNTPEGLVVKGTGLNLGSKISSDITDLGAEESYADRLSIDARPTDAATKWTLGAYQQKTAGDPLTQIIWKGSVDTDWDNRNNWVKTDGTLLTCIDELADNVEMIIPAKDSKYGVKNYPIIPVWAKPADSEKVRAGLTTSTVETVDKFAYSIKLEYGGSIKGVENLKKDEAVHYTKAQSNLYVPAKEWVLVGSVIKKFKSPESPETSETRDIQSGDYYLNHLPHVYMQQFTVNGDNIEWGIPFTSLETPVRPTESFAIFIADQYGPQKLTAAKYYTRKDIQPDSVNNGNKARNFAITGRFVYEDALPSITLNTGRNVLNNAYPASLSKTELAKLLNTLCGSGNYGVYMYDYSNGDWSEMALASDDYIRPQNGFVIANNSGSEKTLNIPQSAYSTTEGSQYKSASADASVILYGYNTSTNKGSKVGVFNNYMNTEKVFNGSVSDNAEIYIIGDDKKYSTISVDDMQSLIPIGVRNKMDSYFSVKFEVTSASDVESVVLEDRSKTPIATYDLLAGEKPYFRVNPGDTEGRFYLNINEYGKEKPMPTSSSDQDEDQYTIDVYSKNGIVSVSVSSELTLVSISLTDMAGHTQDYAPHGSNYSQHRFDVPNGVYIITVVTDKLTEQRKVVINK